MTRYVLTLIAACTLLTATAQSSRTQFQSEEASTKTEAESKAQTKSSANIHYSADIQDPVTGEPIPEPFYGNAEPVSNNPQPATTQPLNPTHAGPRSDSSDRATSNPLVLDKLVETIAKAEQAVGNNQPLSAQEQADSIADLRQRLRPRDIESTFDTSELTVLDTLSTGNDAINVVLFSNNTWVYVRNREIAKDPTIFEKYWNTDNLFPYRDVDMSAIPNSVVIDLVDSVQSYHYPYMGTLHPRGKYGPRRRRIHQGVDLPLKMGDPIYATFCGKVRISQYHRGGYGNLVIIRHDNGLETYYGHLSERMVQPDQWVEAGQVIGLGGSTGRSTGPHLHFEVRYYGQSFDPERLFDFKNGILGRETFLLKKSFFSPYSKAGQDFEEEIANESDDKQEVDSIAKAKAVAAAAKYHKIKSGDNLGSIALRYGTTVSRICQLNKIKSTTLLQLGRSLRVK